jgi:hypothetical protein
LGLTLEVAPGHPDIRLCFPGKAPSAAAGGYPPALAGILRCPLFKWPARHILAGWKGFLQVPAGKVHIGLGYPQVWGENCHLHPLAGIRQRIMDYPQPPLILLSLSTLTPPQWISKLWNFVDYFSQNLKLCFLSYINFIFIFWNLFCTT